MVGIASGTAFYWAMAKSIGPENLAGRTLLAWLGLAVAVSIYAPGGSYLCIWPLLFSVLRWLVIFARPRISGLAKSSLVAVFGIPAIIFLGDGP